MNLKFNVTEEHIKNGVRDYSTSCPIALALREKEPQALLSVLGTNVWIGNEKFYLPESVIEFIKKFDRGENPKPFSFELKKNY